MTTIEEYTEHVLQQAQEAANRQLAEEHAAAIHPDEEPPVEPSRDARPKSKLEWALHHAARGCDVFPVKEEAKFPPFITKFYENASRDPDEIEEWWTEHPNANIAISTSRYKENEAILLVDRDGPEGEKNWVALQLEHGVAPETYEGQTPRGGHAYFVVPKAVQQSAGQIAKKVDVRSHHSYALGAGSVVDGKPYTVLHDRPIAPAPDWLIELCGKPKEKPKPAEDAPPAAINHEAARARAIAYLNTAPVAVDGQGGNDCTLKVALRVKDFGLDQSETFDVLWSHYNPGCQGPWSVDELHAIVKNAYKYGTEPIGASAPEVEFSEPVELPWDLPNGHTALHPYDEMNKDHAFILMGGDARVLWETTDAMGRPQTRHLSLPAFQAKFAPKTINFGDKAKPLADCWLKAKERRAYDGLTFLPEQPTPPRFYNLWKGFAYTAAPPGATHKSVDQLKEHVLNNACGGQVALADWLTGYFAHLVQRPWEKPRIALVFKGRKGVGKNALVERITALLGRHGLVVADKRYLTGNFNGHLENCLALVLDEAFWSGDHQVEGILKNLVTGKEHVIEHKGCEPFTVPNLTRVVIMGNEDWLVPSSADERRYAVFTMGEERKGDHAFFRQMIEGMENGGYPVLLRYLLDIDCDMVDLDRAPLTSGLLEQKEHSLAPLEAWWLQCLRTGELQGGDWPGWPEELVCNRLQAAVKRHAQERNIVTRIPADNAIGRLMKKYAPGFDRVRGKEVDGVRQWMYRLPPLEDARAGWAKYMGQPIKWTE